MHIKHPSGTDNAWHHDSPPQAGRPLYRLVLWAMLGLALLMLTTFVIFGAGNGHMVKEAMPQTQTSSSDPEPAAP